MDRLTEKITDRNTKEILVYRVKCKKDLEAIQKLGKLEDLEEQGKLLKLPCAVGDVVYYRHGGVKIEPMRIEEITITQYAILLTLEYSGNDEKLKHWRIRTDNTAFDNKVVFLTREEAEEALKRMEDKECISSAKKKGLY